MSKLIAPPAPEPGDKFFKAATAFVLRTRGEHDAAVRVERAAVNPAMTTDPAWAGSFVSTTVGGLLLAIAKVSAYAGIAVRTPAFTIKPDLQRAVTGG